MESVSLNAQPVFLKNGDQALLFIHGFTSTPSSLIPTAEWLTKKGWTISLPLLPGHGTTPEDMARQDPQKWLEAALAGYDALSQTYSNVAVAGLSMGAALALHVAANRPVPAVVALSPALYLDDWRRHFIPFMKWFLPWRKAIGNDIKGSRFREISYQRYKLKNIQDLMHVMKVVCQELPAIKAPLLTIQSDSDHVIPPSCMDYLFDKVGSKEKEKVRLTDSYHVITMDNEYEFVAEKMLNFLSAYYPKKS